VIFVKQNDEIGVCDTNERKCHFTIKLLLVRFVAFLLSEGKKRINLMFLNILHSMIRMFSISLCSKRVANGFFFSHPPLTLWMYMLSYVTLLISLFCLLFNSMIWRKI